jgi:hypothetical protein
MASLIFIATFLPARVPVICFFVMLFSIVTINRNFYLFLGRRMGWLTAFTAIPFHVLFYFYNGVAFLTGIVSYFWRVIRVGRSKSTRHSPLTTAARTMGTTSDQRYADIDKG